MTLAFASARRSIIFAWMSRDHGQRPILSMLRLSIAITEILSDGVRAEARTPQSYANRSRPSIGWSWVPLATSSTSDTPRPRNQSFLQKLALVIASPTYSYCCLRATRPECSRILRQPPLNRPSLKPYVKGRKLLNKQNSRRHFYSEYWRSEERRVGKECRSRWSPYH